MVADVNETSILILRPKSNKPTVWPSGVLAAGRRTFALSDVVFGRLKGAHLIDREGNLSEVKAIHIKGITSYKDLGAPFFTYLLLLTLGTLTLTTPVNVELSLERIDKLDLPSVKHHVQSLVKKKPNAYTHDSALRVQRKVATADSVDAIANSIFG